MVCLGIVQVGSATIVAKDDILRVSILVWDEEIGESGSIRYEACVDARRNNGVLCEGAWIT